MIALIGLGNPGKEYERTRHNVGFLALDHLASSVEAPSFQFQKRCASDVTKIKLGTTDILLAKPQTFMNASGSAAAKLKSFYRLKNSDCWILADDVYLSVGVARLRAKGSSGGHNGLQSIMDVFGTSDLIRIRIGVGGDHLPKDLASYVLKPFPSATWKILDQTLLPNLSLRLKHLLPDHKPPTNQTLHLLDPAPS